MTRDDGMDNDRAFYFCDKYGGEVDFQAGGYLGSLMNIENCSHHTTLTCLCAACYLKVQQPRRINHGLGC